MKIIEIILKLAFLVTSVALLVTRDFISSWGVTFTLVSLLLGIVLIFNKQTSYGSWGNMKKDWVMRRIEGVLLIVVAVAGYILIK